jgi:hypothetical protein
MQPSSWQARPKADTTIVRPKEHRSSENRLHNAWQHWRKLFRWCCASTSSRTCKGFKRSRHNICSTSESCNAVIKQQWVRKTSSPMYAFGNGLSDMQMLSEVHDVLAEDIHTSSGQVITKARFRASKSRLLCRPPQLQYFFGSIPPNHSQGLCQPTP